MTEGILKSLHAANVDVDEALARFLGNSAMYERFLLKFAADDNFAQITQAREAADYEAMLTAAHTLKGVSGNLGMKSLFESCSQMVNRLRSGDSEGAMEVYPDLKTAYEQVFQVIKCMEEVG